MQWQEICSFRQPTERFPREQLYCKRITGARLFERRQLSNCFCVYTFWKSPDKQSDHSRVRSQRKQIKGKKEDIPACLFSPSGIWWRFQKWMLLQELGESFLAIARKVKLKNRVGLHIPMWWERMWMRPNEPYQKSLQIKKIFNHVTRPRYHERVT
jgi:hypothetical protein